MSRFGADPRAFFDWVYHDVPPWDIGGPQPAMVALLEAFPPATPILDVGCGSGDLSIFLAQGGVDVIGIDFVSAAIDEANRKARALPAEDAARLEFRVADVFKPWLLQRQFRTIVDSGFLHLLTPEETDRFIPAMSSVLLPGGRYYLHEFATEFEVANTPRCVTEDELRIRFTEKKGWRILEVRSGEFLNRVAPVPAILACVERVAPSGGATA